jgi:hypothetical protein
MPYSIPSDFVLDQVFGYQTANKIKQAIEALAATRLEKSFGGSREASVNVNGVFDVIEFRDVELDATKLTGLTVRARVEGKTANAATSVTPIVRDVTGSIDQVIGAAITATSFTEQILSMTPLGGGVRKYRLRGNTNNATNDVWLLGVCETYA